MADRLQYRFLDRWRVPAGPELTWDVLGEALLYPEWWRSFCLGAEGDEGPPAPGKQVRLLVRGFLPYRVRLEMECLEAERPRRLVSRVGGDLVGSGTWTLEPAPGGGTDVTLGWRPAVNRPSCGGSPRSRAPCSAPTTRGRCAAASARSSPGSPTPTGSTERSRGRGARDPFPFNERWRRGQVNAEVAAE